MTVIYITSLQMQHSFVYRAWQAIVMTVKTTENMERLLDVLCVKKKCVRHTIEMEASVLSV